MLDLMRRQHSKLKWLLLVIIVIFRVGIYSVVHGYGFGRRLHPMWQRVGSEAVSAKEFQVAYRNNIQRMGSQVSPEMLRAFGFDKQVLDYLISQHVISVEARRLGLQVSDRKFRTRFLRYPVFHR